MLDQQENSRLENLALDFDIPVTGENHLNEEIKILRDANLSLQTQVVKLELQIERLVSKRREMYELTETLQERLRENGLSPYITTIDPTPTPEESLSTPGPAPSRESRLTENMRKVLQEVVDGSAVDHGRHVSPRERAGRGRTLDKLQARGLLDTNYRPTDDAITLLAGSTTEKTS